MYQYDTTNSNMLQTLKLKNLLLNRPWSKGDASYFFNQLFDNGIKAGTAVSVLTLLRERGESFQELTAAVQAVRARDARFRFAGSLPHPVDTCGTGGDGKGFFNISTVSAFVAAGAGAFVAKHGNRSISSRVGSSDLLESLGVCIMAPPERMFRALEKSGMGYFHAPLYHPAMKQVQTIRKRIRGRTLFNIIGPLLNPLHVTHQLIGVPDLRAALLIAKTMKVLCAEHGYVVTGEDGADELTPYGVNRGYEIFNGRLRPFVLRASSLKLGGGGEEDLRGGSLPVNTRIATGILTGQLRGPKRKAVLLNAALALRASGVAKSLEEGVVRAEDSLRSGKAMGVLKKLIEISNS
jgi:anthranilate phosphoribosyltransferase